jgi:hypothetical protein
MKKDLKLRIVGLVFDGIELMLLPFVYLLRASLGLVDWIASKK